MPNGYLDTVYGSRPLKAGKNPGKIRFDIKNTESFELLDEESKRIRVVYFNEKMNDKCKKQLSYIKSVYDWQTKL